MSTAPIESLPTAERRRLVAIGLLRALATTVMVVAAYYLLPLDNLAGISLGVALAVGLLALTAVVAYQVRAIIRHPHSAVRAIEALAITVPVFLLLFAATYFMMEQSNPDQLQRRFAHPYRLAVLHGYRLRHGRLRRHHGDQPGGPRGRHRSDDPRPARPRPRGQGVRRRCRDRPRTANDAAGLRIVVNSETPATCARGRVRGRATPGRLRSCSAPSPPRGVDPEIDRYRVRRPTVGSRRSMPCRLRRHRGGEDPTADTSSKRGVTGGGIDAGASQDPPDGRRGEPMAESDELTVDASVAPVGFQKPAWACDLRRPTFRSAQPAGAR